MIMDLGSSSNVLHKNVGGSGIEYHGTIKEKDEDANANANRNGAGWDGDDGGEDGEDNDEDVHDDGDEDEDENADEYRDDDEYEGRHGTKDECESKIEDRRDFGGGHNDEINVNMDMVMKRMSRKTTQQ